MTNAVRTRPDEPAPRRDERGSQVQRRNLLLLWAGQFVNTAGLMMLVPIMPFYLEDMGVRGVAQIQTWAGVAIAAPALALTVATPLWGRLGDLVGRKWMVVRALLGLALAMVVMATAGNPVLLVAGRLLQGALGGVVEAAAAFAGSTGSAKKRGSSLGKSFSATAAGALAGPIFGGLFVGSGGLPRLMLVISAAAAVLAVGCAAGLREPERPAARPHPQQPRRRGGAMQVPGAVPLALAAIGAYFGVYGLIPVFAEHLSGIVTAPGQASLWTGVLHSVMWGATLLGSFWWGKRNDVTGRPLRAFALAAGGCAVGIAAVVLPLGPVALIPLRLLQGFCFAALAQSLFLHFGRHAAEERKSSFISAVNSFLLIGQSAGPLLAGPLALAMPVRGAVLVMAGAAALACLLALGPAFAEKRNPEPDGDPVRDDAGTTPLDPVGAPEEGAMDRTGPGVEVRPLSARALAHDRLRDHPGPGFREWELAVDSLDARRTRSILAAWTSGRVLVHQPEPALFAYEQHGPRGRQQALISDVHLDSRLLPHEEVVPARTREIAEFMERSDLSPPPVLLGYSGDGRTSDHLAQATRRAPLSELRTAEGQTHRLWRLTGGGALADISAELRSRAAFLADGHHRYAAARQVRRQLHAAGRGPGPWDHLAGVLVDTRRSPLRLGPVHRVLPDVSPQQLIEQAAGRFRITELSGDLEVWLQVLLERSARGPAFVITAGDRAFLLADPTPVFRDALVERVPESLRHMHVTALHALLQSTRTGSGIRFEPDPARAVRLAHEFGGTAALLLPPSRQDLRTAAAAGCRLPPKATSFVPKPHPWLLVRSLGADAPA